MAKKKNKSETSFGLQNVDMELLTHKYADYYMDSKRTQHRSQDSEESFLDSIRKIGNEDSEGEDYIWYDTKEVYYPMYKTKVDYEVIEQQELHPIILSLLESIKYLGTLQENDNVEILQALTQLDSEILGSILSDLETKGFIKLMPLGITKNGQEMLDTRKEAILQSESAYVLLDGIFGKVARDNKGLCVAKSHKDIMLESHVQDFKDCIKLKPSSKDLRPRIENLDKDFSENKTLRSVLVEALNSLDYIESSDKDSKNSQNSQKQESKNDKDSQNNEENSYTETQKHNHSEAQSTKDMANTHKNHNTSNNPPTQNTHKESEQDSSISYKAEITDITDIDPKKFYKKYICLFYKSKSESEKILVIDSTLEIDRESTELFDKLIDTQSFESARKDSKGFLDNEAKFQANTPELIRQKLELDFSEGATIETNEHKKYFLYIFENAKKEICIQSPWVRYEIIEQYKNSIESALERGVKITIKYGMKLRNKFNKVGIDEKSKEYFTELQNRYADLFHLKECNDHSKIVICDEEFMILGSFNWLSFGGNADRDGESRGETSNINKNLESIRKEKAKFKH